MKAFDFLMTGEGPTDYGQKVFGSAKWEEGPAAVLVRKCADEADVDITLFFAERKNVENVKLGRQIKGLQGKAIPARRFYMYMKEQGYENGIYYCDADREAGVRNTRHQAEERFKNVYCEVEKGANLDVGRRNVIPMVALRMIESWLMADEEAFGEGKKFGKRKKDIPFPSEPELLWGDKRDPESNYPKNYLARLYSYYFRGQPHREDYVSIAENSRIQKIAEKCPISFQRFKEDFQSFIDAAKEYKE